MNAGSNDNARRESVERQLEEDGRQERRRFAEPMNTPTPTPRTDGLPQPSHFTAGDLAAWVDAAHKRIRQLERELAEAQRENYDMFTRLDSQELRAENQYREIAKDRNAWRECADRLADSLLRTNHDCHELSHHKGEYHEGFDCPVVNKILKALAAYDKLKEASK